MRRIEEGHPLRVAWAGGVTRPPARGGPTIRGLPGAPYIVGPPLAGGLGGWPWRVAWAGDVTRSDRLWGHPWRAYTGRFLDGSAWESDGEAFPMPPFPSASQATLQQIFPKNLPV